MIAFYAGILILCLWKISFSKKSFFNDFLQRDQCDSIKGIFILLVFVRHILQYIIGSGYDFSAMPDQLFLKIDRELDQLIVVMFLFYSGYGIMESIFKKKADYVKSMPLKRILPTILNFDIAVLAFFILNLFIGREMTVSEVLLSFTGWDSIGNSNWYIFVIVVCYAIVWLSFFVTSKAQALNPQRALVFASFLFIIALITLALTKKEWWYNTILAFDAGLLFSYYKEKIVPTLQKKYGILFVLSTIAFAGLHILHNRIPSPLFNLECIIFALCVILITMKVKIKNPALLWLGEHLFPLYIYQRLAMIALSRIDDGAFVKNNPLVYMLICCAIMILIAIPYRFFRISFNK